MNLRFEKYDCSISKMQIKINAILLYGCIFRKSKILIRQ